MTIHNTPPTFPPAANSVVLAPIPLSPREAQVLRLLAAGHTIKRDHRAIGDQPVVGFGVYSSRPPETGRGFDDYGGGEGGAGGRDPGGRMWLG